MFTTPPKNTLHHSTSESLCDLMPDNHLDAIVTDTPWGMKFMGKKWDLDVPSVASLEKQFRVLKPGGFGFYMMAPRQDLLAKMINNLAEAGFETSFSSIYWTYSTGFPKAMNIAKEIDKKKGTPPEVIGKQKHPTAKAGRTGTKSPYQNESSLASDSEITKPTSPEAQAFNGAYAGYQPKPAVEVIIVVMKPLAEKSYTNQALANGKGVTWLNEARIPYANTKDYETVVDNFKGGIGRATASKETWSLHDGGWKLGENIEIPMPELGRFPANLIVSDDALNDGTVYYGQQGEVTGEEPSNFKRGNTHGDYSGVGNPMPPRQDEGSYSRYYDVDKWWEEKVKDLPKQVKEIFPFLIVPKPPKSEKDFGVKGKGRFMDESREIGSAGGSNPRNRGAESMRKNFHPTVKPIKLMSYLITLASKPGDLIFEPYAGSGTTCISAEILDRRWIASEMELESVEIALQRIKPYQQQMTLFKTEPQ